MRQLYVIPILYYEEIYALVREKGTKYFLFLFLSLFHSWDVVISEIGLVE